MLTQLAELINTASPVNCKKKKNTQKRVNKNCNINLDLSLFFYFRLCVLKGKMLIACLLTSSLLVNASSLKTGMNK